MLCLQRVTRRAICLRVLPRQPTACTTRFPKSNVVIDRYYKHHFSSHTKVSTSTVFEAVSTAVPSNTGSASTSPFVPVNFNDSEQAFHSKTMSQLIRSLFVYRICTVRPLVRNAGAIILLCYKILGPNITNAFMKYTFFGHFCGGEDEKTIKPVVDYLHRNGIGSIFDYAAESDVAEDVPSPAPPAATASAITKAKVSTPAAPAATVIASSSSNTNTTDTTTDADKDTNAQREPHSIKFPDAVLPIIETVEAIVPAYDPADMPPDTPYTSSDETKGRVYHYIDEDVCDKHLSTFEDCIKSVNNVSPTGFAAIKITALGNPKLLKRVSITLNEMRRLFVKFDSKGTGIITAEDFLKQYRDYFIVSAEAEATLNERFRHIDRDGDGMIDYIEWSNAIVLENIREMVSNCKNKNGPLSQAMLSEEEMELLNRMRKRVDKLASLADTLGVRLMIDAEHSYFQPAIDHIAQQLSAKYNTKDKKFPIIFNTYQMYLQNSSKKLHIDLERCRRNNTHFAAKIVRGAYMVLERAHALETNNKDPILPTLEATHENYNRAIATLITQIANPNGAKVEVVIATHNQQSIELALKQMELQRLPPSSMVYFGQLLGMADHLTFHLGSSGYKAYKYVPYGKVNEVMPYLIRRAQENADVLGNAKHELKMITTEIKRRLNPMR